MTMKRVVTNEVTVTASFKNCLASADSVETELGTIFTIIRILAYITRSYTAMVVVLY